MCLMHNTVPGIVQFCHRVCRMQRKGGPKLQQLTGPANKPAVRIQSMLSRLSMHRLKTFKYKLKRLMMVRSQKQMVLASYHRTLEPEPSPPRKHSCCNQRRVVVAVPSSLRPGGSATYHHQYSVFTVIAMHTLPEQKP